MTAEGGEPREEGAKDRAPGAKVIERPDSPPVRYSPPTTLRLIVITLLYHWRSNLAVACGVAAGAAVLTGALLVGDSMRGSLRHLTLERLGRIDSALVTDHLFRARWADEWAAEAAFSTRFAAAVPAILLRVSLENPNPQSLARASRVDLIGCDARFWRLGSGGPKQAPRAREIVLNGPLAEQLGVRAGDTVLLRLPRPGAVAADSPLGNKRETIVTQRLTVCEVIPAEGLGRFGLRATQQLVHNAYVPLEWLANQLGQPGGANAIFLAGNDRNPSAASADVAAIQSLVHPTPADEGLTVQDTPRGYVNITSDRMLLPAAAEAAIVEALRQGGGKEGRTIQPALTYLANAIAVGDREIPYSTATAIDFSAAAPLGPFVSTDGKVLPPLGANEIALNAWAADNLHAKVGDSVRMTFFEPESIDGQVRDKTVALRLAAVVRLSDAADDRALTPPVKGITDELTMADWNPPFPFHADRVRPADEQYWRRYGPTPKAFVSLATGRQLWGSRFGQATAIRVGESGTVKAEGGGRKAEEGNAKPGVANSRFQGPHPNPLPEGEGTTTIVLPEGEGTTTIVSASQRVLRQLQEHLDPSAMGFLVQPIKAQALAASAGTTPFGGLFVLLSLFVIAAAMMLVALLFRLGVEQRAVQIGILMAVGLSRRNIRRLLLGEGLAVAAVGSVLGVPLGIGYAALMLLGLRTWWLGAIGTPFLRLCLTSESLLIGCLSGMVTVMAAILWSVRRIGHVPVRRLLAGQVASPQTLQRGQSHFRRTKSGTVPRTKIGTVFRTKIGTIPLKAQELLLVLLAIVPAVVLLGLSWAVRISAEAQAGAFFMVGATSLMALLILVWLRWKTGRTGPAVAVGRGNVARMALRNAARNPGRSTLTVGLVAAASFLIVAVSAFHVDPSQQTPALRSGNGGFALVAESDQPIFQNLNSPEGRDALGFSPDDEKLLAGSTIIGARVRPGDDASCLNLYQPRQPRLLGLPARFLDRDGFAWADKPRDCVNPWLLLNDDLGRDADGVARVPVILEKNTANYSLHLWGGLGETFDITDSRGAPLRLQVVALLADSIFQSDLLISETALLKQFPDVSGYRFFLVETPPGQTNLVRAALHRNLGDYGFAMETTGQRLAAFLAVQNTYLSTFQSLGGLGLLLGTFGLAAVQLRNVLERHGELAILRAAGFRRRTLAWLVLLENAVLLGTGLLVGLLAALLAVLPQVLEHATSIPWASLGATLAAVFLTGLLAGALAVRAAVRIPLLDAICHDS
jgi:ABC-type antimicrobial peptide transport system permease subunit